MTLWVHVLPTPVGTFILHLLVYTCAHDIHVHTYTHVLYSTYESYILIHVHSYSCVPVWLCVYTRVPVCLCATGTVVGIRVYTRSFS